MQIIFNATRIGGTWSNWYDSMFKCGGFNRKDFFCVKDLDDQFQQVPGLRTIATNASSWPRQIQRDDPGELLFRPGVPPCVRQRDRTAHRGTEVAGRVSDDHHAATPIPGKTSRSHSASRRCSEQVTVERTAMGQFMIRRTFYAVVTLFISEPDHLHGGQADGRSGDADGGARARRRPIWRWCAPSGGSTGRCRYSTQPSSGTS